MPEVTEFLLLGPMVVRCGGTTVPVETGKQRALLAALLLNANRVVSLDELAEVLWGAEPPPSARVTMRNYVKRLRRALACTGETRISTHTHGYLIEADTAELDVSQFEELSEQARQAVYAGRWDLAVSGLRSALSLWRGEPLMDVSSELLALREVPWLVEARFQAVAARIEADLQLGHHSEVISELRQLASAEPLRERLHALLMLALYRDGRPAEALAAYRDARRVLDRELGAEPGRELQELHQRILAADSTLAVPAADRHPAASNGLGAPRQLPGAVAHFAGRARELRQLWDLIEENHGGAAVVISVIGGTAGVGKTALAVHWAHQVAERFPDGQLYVNLRGFDPCGSQMTVGQAIPIFLDALGVPAERIPVDIDAQAGLYRSMLAGKRILVVADNARDAEHVRLLLPGTPGCMAVVTSRTQLAGLVVAGGAHLINLDVLTQDEAHELLVSRLGAQRVAAEPEAATEIIGLCARLPLALAVAAVHVTARPGFSLAALAVDLRGARHRLDALDPEDPTVDVRAVFSWSYQQLSDPAARMFRLLGIHAGPDISAPAAASLAGIPLAQAGRALRELAGASLLAEHVPGRFAFHDLLRAYAAEQAQATDDEQACHAAIRRVLDHYLHTAQSADSLLNPARDQLTLAPCEERVRPERFADYAQAMAWFRAEYKVLRAVLTLAVDAGCDTHAWQLPWTMVDFCEFSGQWHDWIAIQRIAIAAARRLGHGDGEAQCCRALGNAYSRTGRDNDALEHLRQALSLFREVGDVIGEARTHQDLSWMLDRQGQQALALDHDQIALRLYEQADHRAGQANALNAIGWLHALLGDYREAVDHCRRALVLHRELGNRRGEAATLDSLGYAYQRLRQHGESFACYRRSLSLFRKLADRSNVAEILTHLGDAHLDAGSPGQARDAWQQALVILDELHDPGAGQVRAKLTAARTAAPGADDPSRPAPLNPAADVPPVAPLVT
jgi:DNA-binding SARP family transcriptional activator